MEQTYITSNERRKELIEGIQEDIINAVRAGANAGYNESCEKVEEKKHG